MILTFRLWFSSFYLSHMYCYRKSIITLTWVDSQIQTPLYFFCQNFSFLEISFTAVCIPRFLEEIITRDKTISYNCAAWLFFSIFMGVTEFHILTSMSYDHYVAICKPLHYTTIVSRKFCSLRVLCAWAGQVSYHLPMPYAFHPAGLLCFQLRHSNHFLITVSVTVFPFYNCLVHIDHLVCDCFPLLQLSCSDTWLPVVMGFLLCFC